jgi:N-acetylmuramoyl-L-alanine amidase
MPGALIELLFITNPSDAAILQNEAAREAMARGITRGILERLAR